MTAMSKLSFRLEINDILDNWLSKEEFYGIYFPAPKWKKIAETKKLLNKREKKAHQRQNQLDRVVVNPPLLIQEECL